MRREIGRGAWVLLGVLAAGGAWAQERVVYKCPGNLYTDAISAKDAETRGCKRLEGGGVTVIEGGAAARRASASNAQASTPRSADTRVEPADQRARDADKRRILELELSREEARLATLRAEYNNGEPERLGNEKNYQKYLDRVADLKAGIERSESDIAALKRELAKLPPG